VGAQIRREDEQTCAGKSGHLEQIKPLCFLRITSWLQVTVYPFKFSRPQLGMAQILFAQQSDFFAGSFGRLDSFQSLSNFTDLHCASDFGDL